MNDFEIDLNFYLYQIIPNAFLLHPFVVQRELPDRVCLPVLCGRPCDLSSSGEASSYLRQLRVNPSSLLWRDDVDLLKLQHTRGLSLTLLRDDLLLR